MKVNFGILFGTTLMATSIHAQPNNFTLNTWLPTEQHISQPLQETHRVITEVFKDLNIELTINSKPPERSIREANNGIADGDFMRISTISTLYPNLIKVPQSIGYMDFVVFSALDNIDLSRGWHGLADYKIGYVTGWKIVEQHISQFKHSYPVGNETTLFSMLAADRFDIVIYGKQKGLRVLAQLNIRKITPKSPALSSQEMYLYVHRKHQNLVPQLAEAIKKVTANADNQLMMSAQ